MRILISILVAILIVILPVCNNLNHNYRPEPQITNAAGDMGLTTSDWVADGTGICTAIDFQNFPQLCSDGAGGAIIAWADLRNGSFWDIYAQRIDASGVAQWTANGVAICTANNDQKFPQLCSDDIGGAIIVWADCRSGTYYDIYAQRVDASGVAQWTVNGVAICTASMDQGESKLCSDNKSGAIITWLDQRNGITNTDVYAQQINATGAVQWRANGTAICTAINNQWWVELCSDDANGAIISWADGRGAGWDIYAQRVNSSGAMQWLANGTAICTLSSTQEAPQLCSDGAGGAIIAWEDFRNGSYWDIYAQLVNSSGARQWTADGVGICTANMDQWVPRLCSDEAGGAIIVWSDCRGSSYDIYTQRVNASGAAQWTADGVAICTASGYQSGYQLCSDNAGGAIITWSDHRSGSSYDIYAQRVDSSGAPQWTVDGVAICTANRDQQDAAICSDGAGGAFIIWKDFRSVYYSDIYALLIDSTGHYPTTPPIPFSFPLSMLLGLLMAILLGSQLKPKPGSKRRITF